MTRTLADTAHTRNQALDIKGLSCEDQVKLILTTDLHLFEKGKQSVWIMITDFGVFACVHKLMLPFSSCVTLENVLFLSQKLHLQQNGNSDTQTSGLFSELNEIV